MKTDGTFKNDLYLKKISKMNRFELLEEVSKFQAEETALAQLPLTKLVQGKVLFEFMAQKAESTDLQLASMLQKNFYEGALNQHYR